MVPQTASNRGPIDYKSIAKIRINICLQHYLKNNFDMVTLWAQW